MAPLGITSEQEQTLISVITEADRYVRDTPTELIDRDALRQLFDEAIAQLHDTGLCLEGWAGTEGGRLVVDGIHARRLPIYLSRGAALSQHEDVCPIEIRSRRQP